eukprot:UN02058
MLVKPCLVTNVVSRNYLFFGCRHFNLPLSARNVQELALQTHGCKTKLNASLTKTWSLFCE